MKHDHRSFYRSPSLDGGSEFQNRRLRRMAAAFSCRLFLGEKGYDGFVEDVSHRGFKIRTNAPVLVGREIMLDIVGIGVVPAQVRWSIGGRAGGIFLARLGEETFEKTDPANSNMI